MIILFLIILGLLTLGLVFAPAFIVSVMKLTILMIFCFVCTRLFMKHKEVSYLIIALYVFAVITMASQAIGPKIEDIHNKLSTMEKVINRAEQITR